MKLGASAARWRLIFAEQFDPKERILKPKTIAWGMTGEAEAEQFDPKERILKLKKWINVQIAFYAEQFDPKERILKRPNNLTSSSVNVR